MIRFVPADVGTIGQKRKQVSRACNGCRAKKKRCRHVKASPKDLDSQIQAVQLAKGDDRIDATNDDYATSPTADSSTIPASTRPSLQVSPSENTRNPACQSTIAAPPQDTLGSRFVDGLNPEGVFLAVHSPQDTRGAFSHDRVGIWLADKLNSKEKQNDRTLTRPWPRSSLLAGLTPMIQKVLFTGLEEECLSLLPPHESIRNLTSIYFKRFHPILPIINESAFRSLGRTDPAYVLLQQGICLVASMIPSSKRYLFLGDSEVPLQHREFGKRVVSAMRISTEAGVITDKIVLIQALVLMWMFSDGPDARDVSSMLCARAVQHVQSLGFHVYKKSPDQAGHYESTMLCCVWAIDRLNAAFHGRPVLMHERDFGIDLAVYIDSQMLCTRLFLHVISWLDKVIDMYRPNAELRSSDLEIPFDSFEDLLVQSQSLRIPTPLLGQFIILISLPRAVFSLSRIWLIFSPKATIETLYHAVSMLSCRPRSFNTKILSSASRSRRDLSAERVTSLVLDEQVGQLTYFPFVPYAVSLSLSVAYSEMRHTKVPMLRARARDKLQINCDLLERLGEIFYLAGLMSDMGKSTLDEYDRIYLTAVENYQQNYSGSCAALDSIGATERVEIIGMLYVSRHEPLD